MDYHSVVQLFIGLKNGTNIIFSWNEVPQYKIQTLFWALSIDIALMLTLTCMDHS